LSHSLVTSVVIAALSLTAVGAACAQSTSSSGSNWNSSWGFKSATDTSVALQRAQAIRNAETTASPSTVVTYNNVYNTDSRSNYVDVTTSGDVDTEFQIGDDIGQSTYSVGSLNTGTTNIDIEGSSNVINATNSADNSGCVDGSALESLINDPAFLETLRLADAVGNTMGDIAVDIGTLLAPQSTCVY
jgi:hypothetical protein